ncbi:unnamed protein product, partial [Allacma fusca]
MLQSNQGFQKGKQGRRRVFSNP